MWHVATRLDRMVAHSREQQTTKSQVLSITWSYEVTWQIPNVIYPFPLDLWAKFFMRRVHYVQWSLDVIVRWKIKQCIYFFKNYRYQTLERDDLWLCATTHSSLITSPSIVSLKKPLHLLFHKSYPRQMRQGSSGLRHGAITQKITSPLLKNAFSIYTFLFNLSNVPLILHKVLRLLLLVRQ